MKLFFGFDHKSSLIVHFPGHMCTFRHIIFKSTLQPLYGPFAVNDRIYPKSSIQTSDIHISCSDTRHHSVYAQCLRMQKSIVINITSHLPRPFLRYKNMSPNKQMGDRVARHHDPHINERLAIFSASKIESSGNKIRRLYVHMMFCTVYQMQIVIMDHLDL